MATIGADRCAEVAGTSKGALPRSKILPPAPANQYPRPYGLAAMPTIGLAMRLLTASR